MPVKDGEQQWREFADFATLEKLLEVGQSLIVVRNLGALLQKITESAGAVLGADVIVLYEYHEEVDDVTVPPIIWGDLRHPEVPMGRDQVRPHRESAVFKMLERTEPFYASNAREDWAQLIEKWSREEGSSGNFVHREGIVSSAAVPLTADAERVGVLFVNYRTHHAFPDKEQKIIELFATQAAIAIQNARFLADLQRQVKGHRALNSVGAKLAGMLDEETILNCVARSAADTLDCIHCSVFRIEVGELIVVAAEGNRAWSLQPGRTFKLGQGVAGWVAQNGQSALVRNTLEDKRFEPGWSKPKGDPQSLVVVPIFLGGEVYGVISAEQDRVGAFDEQDQRLIETLALQASQAVQNARLLQQEQTLRQQAETLREVSGAISSALELREVAERILDELGKVVEYRKASMQLIRDDTRTLIAYRGFKGKKFDEWLLRPISQDRLISRIVASEQPLILPEPSKDPDWEIRPETANVKSWVGLPLIYGGEAIGLLTLDHDQPGLYTQALEHLLVSFANQAAIAIKNARLFDNAERRIRDLEIVNDIAQIMSTRLDTEDLLRTVVSQIADKLNCTHCTLFFPKEEKGEVLLVTRVTQGLLSDQIMRRRFKPDEGLAGWVFQHGTSLVLADAKEDPRFAPATVERDRPRSMLVAPVKVGDRTIGIISADQDEYGWFSESDRRLVDALARHAGIAIERATGLELLQDIGNRIISAPKVDDVLQEIVSGAIKLTHTTSGTIYLFSEDGKSVINSFLYPPGFDHPAPRMDREGGITRQVIATGEMQVFQDIKQDDRINPALHGLGIRSMIAIPLKLEGRVIGVLYLNDANQHDFTETEVSLLSTLANQAAIAIQNARLFEEVRTRADEVSLLQRVSAQISTTLSLDDILPSLVEGAMRLTKTESGVVHVLDSSGEKILGSYGYPKVFSHPSPRISEEGYTRLIIQRKEQQVVRDAQIDERANPEVKKKGIRSFVGTPLKLEGERVVGVLYVNDTSVRQFTEEELSLLRALADQAAIAIYNSRLYQEARTRAEALKKLHEVGPTLVPIAGAPESLEAILTQVAQNAQSVLDADLVDLYQYVQSRDEYVLPPIQVGERYDPSMRPETIHEDDVVCTIVKSSRPQYVPEAQQEPTLTQAFMARPDAPPARFVIREDVKSTAAVPLIVGTEVVGVLFANYRSPQAFPQQQRELIELFASQAAMAIRNARLFEQRRTLQDIARDVTRILDKDELLQKILERSVELLGCEIGSIALLNKATNQLEFQYAIGKERYLSVSFGEGLIGTAAETRKPVRVGDVTKDSRYIAHVATTRSELDVPMLIGEELVGVLNAESTRPDAFDADSEELAVTLASQAAVALYNAALFEQRNALVDFEQAVTSGIRLREEEVLELIHQQASKLMDTDNMYIALYDEATDTVRFGLAFVDGRRVDVATVEGWQPRKAGKGRTEEIIRTKKPLFHPTREDGEKWYAEPGHEEYVGGPLPSWLGVPMMVGERVLGVIVTYHPERDYVYSIDDLMILQAMANQAAIALDNAAFYHKVEKHSRQLETVRQVVNAITTELEPQACMERILDETMKLLDAHYATIQLVDEATNELVIHAQRGVEGKSLASELRRIKIGQGVTGAAAQENRTIRVGNVQDVDYYLDYIVEGTRSEMATPLIEHGKVIGVLNVEDPRENAFDQDDEDLFKLLAEQVIIAVQNARKVEASRKEQERLAEAERLEYLGLLAGGVAHRVGSKGGLIRLHVGNLRKLVPSEADDVRAVLDKVERDNEYLIELSEALFKPANAAETPVGPVNVNQLLKQAIRRAAVPSNVAISFDKGRVPRVNGNRWLVEVFVELITNAVRAMSECAKKRLTICSRLIDEDIVTVVCEDTGCGIAPEEMSKVFNLFYTRGRAEETPSRGGYGLWYSKSIVTRMGGDLQVESEVGKGTKCTVVLAVAE